ncbi:hypoxanthine phosphoribosyltransferase [Rhabdobacter roseus]|uniref:Hypoxanthine phosphoribosyltransferase n=1 Tax=Rhabdobacter roseus TaxID=1655419 RepID=A0A840TSP7_9BACT|nr:hypoxanthine phosphoribosyltransferase [Rhabdobacter roseus]MBB5284717.1 hypoxanthine phosphoribosyltransferase [Rhabdobacter roseus]
MVTVKDKVFAPFIEKEQLAQRIAELADKINTDYAGRTPLLVVVLNGAFLFAADLIRHITIPCEVSFIRLASYAQTQSTGRVKQVLGLQEPVAGRDVVVVEDIVDTGLTMAQLVQQLWEQEASSVEIATLLYKPEAIRESVTLRYVGFEIQNRFVVGFGLDYDGQGRNLDAIYVLAN